MCRTRLKAPLPLRERGEGEVEQQKFAKHLRTRMTDGERLLWRRGFTALWFWKNEIVNILEVVLTCGVTVMADAPLSPGPSPARGEG